jgi:hypothetical protein
MFTGKRNQKQAELNPGLALEVHKCIHCTSLASLPTYTVHRAEGKVLKYICSKLRPSGRLDGVVVSVLATGPKGHRFKHGRGDGFLRAIKICSTPSFDGK